MATLQQTNAPVQAGKAQPAAAPEPAPASRAFALMALMPGEEAVAELPAVDGASFLLTDRRVVYTGGREEEAVYASVRAADITSVVLARRPRDRRAVIWAVAGFIAALGAWQVTSNETVGAVAGAVVGAISLGLLADYWFRPGGLVLRLHSAGGSAGGPVEARAAARAAEFAASVEEARARASSPVAQAGAEKPAQGEAPRRSYPAV